MPTDFTAIVTGAHSRQAQLLAINSAIDVEVHNIIASATPGIGLTADDIVRIQGLHKKQAVILTSIQELALVTAAALDDGDTLKHIAASLTAAVGVLKTEAAAIATISATCATINTVCTGLDGIIGQLTTLIGGAAASAGDKQQ
jgi:hypothetical protein